MGYRGRLIFPFTVELARLNTTATAGDPDAAGPLTSGYDDDFKEPNVFEQAGERKDSRQETMVRLPAQIESNVWEQLNQLRDGNVPTTRVSIVFHFQDLEAAGMVDAATGEAMIRVNDRLHAIYELASGKLVQIIRTPPGLYVVESQPTSFGLSAGTRNLLVVSLEDRQQGANIGA